MLISPHDYLDQLLKIKLINDNISREYLDTIVEDINIIFCKKGQQFLMEGAPVNGLFFICSGKAKVLKTGIYGKEQILRFVGEGEMIGHRGFGTSNKYGISAVAIDDCLLCNLTNSIMERMLKDFPSLTYDLMLFYAEELNRSENKVKAFAQMTVREKVIDSLLYLNRKFGVNKKGYINIKLSRKEIGDYSGTNNEQVIKIISQLKSEGLVEANGKLLKIPNVDLLKKEIIEHNFFLDT
ncbi:Crp/Fnr family transcriptional regulator [Tenacibaculum xiamenense]|uniref:Crp/Fnr family transcriptional regulator n=1 Tax=Tenacibaculum xiamenense TaxID=1261553 RepID=UPI003894A7A8